MSSLKDSIQIDKTLPPDIYIKEFIEAAEKLIHDESQMYANYTVELNNLAKTEMQELKAARDKVMASGEYKDEDPIAIPAHKQWKPSNPLLVKNKKAESTNILASKQKELQDGQKALKSKMGDLQRAMDGHRDELQAIKNSLNRKLFYQIFFVPGGDNEVRRIYPKAKFTRGGIATFTQENGQKSIVVGDLGIDKVLNILSQKVGAPFNKPEASTAMQKAAKMGFTKFVEDKSITDSSKNIVCAYGAFVSTVRPDVKPNCANDVTDYIVQCMHALEAIIDEKHIAHDIYIEKGEKFKADMLAKAKQKKDQEKLQNYVAQQRQQGNTGMTPPPPPRMNQPMQSSYQQYPYQQYQQNPNYVQPPQSPQSTYHPPQQRVRRNKPPLPDVDSDNFW